MSDSIVKEAESVKHEKPLLTPHEYFNYHLQNPNEPITDADIMNLKLDSGAVSKEHAIKGDTDVLNETDTDDNAGNEESPTNKAIITSYDVIDNP